MLAFTIQSSRDDVAFKNYSVSACLKITIFVRIRDTGTMSVVHTCPSGPKLVIISSVYHDIMCCLLILVNHVSIIGTVSVYLG